MPQLLEIFRRPLTRSSLKQEGHFLIAEVGGLAYPVRDGIPVMLVEEARLPASVASLDDFKLQLCGEGSGLKNAFPAPSHRPN